MLTLKEYGYGHRLQRLKNMQLRSVSAAPRQSLQWRTLSFREVHLDLGPQCKKELLMASERSPSVSTPRPDREAEAVLEKVASLVSAGVPPGEIIVLAQRKPFPI